MKPEFAALNPNRKMPVLEDDGFLLWESNAIMQYLASKRPEAGLWPANPRHQADVSRWQCWELAHWERACGTLVFERFVKGRFGQGDPDPGEVARGERDFHQVAQVLDQHLRGRDWLVGRGLTLADVSVGAWLTVAQYGRYPMAEYKEIARWSRGLEALPAWQKATVPPARVAPRGPRASSSQPGRVRGKMRPRCPCPSRDRKRRSVLQELLPRVQDPAVTRREEALVREMLETSLKLLRDSTSIGDLKILNAALRELRYAFKVFAPYRGVRKVSVFGSARTPPGDPAYRTAAEFSREIASRGYMIVTGGGHGIMRACQEGAGRERSFGVNIRLPFEQDAERVHPGRSEARDLPLLLHPQADVHEGGGRHRALPGRVRNPRRGLRSAHADADGKDEPRADRLPRRTPRHLLEDLAPVRERPPAAPRPDLGRGPVALQDDDQHPGGGRGDHHLLPRVPLVAVRRSRLGDPAEPPRCRSRWCEDLAREFAPLVAEGAIEQRDALPEEHETEPELDHLPRLVFAARRTAFGLRRRLIDRLNRDG